MLTRFEVDGFKNLVKPQARPIPIHNNDNNGGSSITPGALRAFSSAAVFP